MPLWNKRVILSRRKSMYMEDWMMKLICSIVHIMDGNGNILQLKDFNAKYKFNCSNEIYRKVIQNIPKVLIQSMKNNILNLPTPKWHKMKVDLDRVHVKCNNTFLKQYLVNTLYPGLTKSTFILRHYKKLDVENCYICKLNLETTKHYFMNVKLSKDCGNLFMIWYRPTPET